MMNNDEKTEGEVGIFPTLLNPAKEVAEHLGFEEVKFLPSYPSFGVCHKDDFSSQGHFTTTFNHKGKKFVLFEVDV